MNGVSALRALITFACCGAWLVTGVALLPAQSVTLPPGAIQVPAGTGTWIAAPSSLPPGTRMLLLEGSPASDGFFTMRVRVPAGARLQPHWHPGDERVTILSGRVLVGFGDRFDESTMTEFGPGSFYLNPARSHHYVWVVEETEMQLTGIGPWEIHLLQPETDASGSSAGPDLDGWRRAAPEEVGLDAGRLAEMTEAIRRQEYANIHAVLIERDGRLVYEEYFEGEDVRWGHGLGHVVFDPETLHDVRSVTKSVVSALVGIAIASGHIASVDQPLFEFFPEHADLATPQKQAITLRHALTMSAGFEWDENIPYSDERNDEIRMGRSDDPTRFVLSRPLTSEPGALFNYSGGLTHLLAAVVQRTTGQPVTEYAREKLFEPLGITELEWLGDLGGLPAAASGLRLRPRDLAKLGSLYLNEGRWQDRQILPAEWVRESTRWHLSWPDPETEYGTHGYGYQWWHSRSPVGTETIEIFAAVGNGGQRILVLPALRMVVTVNAGRYNDASAGWLPEQLLFERILPAVRELKL